MHEKSRYETLNEAKKKMEQEYEDKKVNLRKIHDQNKKVSILYDIYKRREYYYHKVPQRDILKSYDEITNFRNQQCKDGEKDINR